MQQLTEKPLKVVGEVIHPCNKMALETLVAENAIPSGPFYVEKD